MKKLLIIALAVLSITQLRSMNRSNNKQQTQSQNSPTSSQQQSWPRRSYSLKETCQFCNRRQGVFIPAKRPYRRVFTFYCQFSDCGKPNRIFISENSVGTL